MLFLRNEDVRQVLTMEHCLQAVEDCTREIDNGRVIPAPYNVANYPYTDDGEGANGLVGPTSYYSLHLSQVLDLVHGVALVRMNSMPRRVKEVHGVKQEVARVDTPGSTGHTHTEMPSFVFIFDIYKPRTLCLMQERDFQAMRVGAVGALGAKYMARKDAHTIGLLGSGWMARAEIPAHCMVRDIRLVKVFSPTPEHREIFAKKMSSKLGIEVRPVASAKEAIQGTDIVISATNCAAPPSFDPELVEPGMHVSCVTPMEYDEPLVAKMDVIAWSYPGQERITYRPQLEGDAALMNPKHDRYRHYLWCVLQKQKYLTKRVFLTDMVAGRVAGRTDDRQITFFSSPAGGTAGTERYAILVPRIYEMAKAAGLGKELPDEWFHQTDAQLW